MVTIGQWWVCRGKHSEGWSWHSSCWYTTRWKGRARFVFCKQGGAQCGGAVCSWRPSIDFCTIRQRCVLVLVHQSYTEQQSALSTYSYHYQLWPSSSHFQWVHGTAREGEKWVCTSTYCCTQLLSLGSLVGQMCVCVYACVMCVWICICVCSLCIVMMSMLCITVTPTQMSHWSQSVETCHSGRVTFLLRKWMVSHLLMKAAASCRNI